MLVVICKIFGWMYRVYDSGAHSYYLKKESESYDFSYFGVPYPFLLSVLAFVLEFIPFLGVYITGAAIVLLALTQGWVTGLLALGIFVILQNLENNVLSPRIVGGAVGINPIINIFAVIAGTNLFGIAGAFFAAPVAGFIQALLQAIWSWWQKSHPEQFPDEQNDAESPSKDQMPKAKES
jgi:predicted PurR-regulated permease PerM